MSEKQFINSLRELGININDEQLKKLNDYFNMLVEKNKVMNLTAITSKEEVYLKHFYDSATIVKIVDLNSIDSLCDLGTGAGFPGIVLKILYPKLNITLVDSLQKRINFLNEVIEKLNLKNIVTVHARMEEFVKNHEEKFDVITARAVAHLSILLEYSIKGIKIGGKFIAMKSSIEEELKESDNAISKLGFKLENVVNFNLPIIEAKRSLVSLEKIKKTNMKYPRKYSDIKKKPL